MGPANISTMYTAHEGAHLYGLDVLQTSGPPRTLDGASYIKWMGPLYVLLVYDARQAGPQSMYICIRAGTWVDMDRGGACAGICAHQMGGSA